MKITNLNVKTSIIRRAKQCLSIVFIMLLTSLSTACQMTEPTTVPTTNTHNTDITDITDDSDAGTTRYIRLCFVKIVLMNHILDMGYIPFFYDQYLHTDVLSSLC